jgi:hypothetical protein
MTTAELFLALAHRLSRDKVVSVADLLSLSQRPTPSWRQRIFPVSWLNSIRGPLRRSSQIFLQLDDWQLAIERWIGNPHVPKHLVLVSTAARFTPNHSALPGQSRF